MTSPSLFIDGYIPAEYSSALNTVAANDVPFWRSKPRAMSDTTYDILKINFRQAVLITDISFDMLKISNTYSVYYTNRNNLLLPVVLSDNTLFNGTTLTSEEFVLLGSNANVAHSANWQSINKTLYPIVANSLEIRIQRNPDSKLTSDAVYRLGVRRLTLKRTIATEQNKYLAITDTVDVVGNYVTKTFLDWEPEKGADGDTTTFWKSAPQPSPSAVVSYYLDVRNANGDASAVDKIWIDPAYTGPQINLYYSNDDTESTATLSTVAIAPLVNTNVTWSQSSGVDLTSVSADLEYAGTRLGMTPGENYWISLVLNPAFDSSQTVGANLNLFVWDNISIVYNDSAKTVTFKSGTLSVTTGALSFLTGDRMIFVFQLRSLTDSSPGIDGYVYHGTALASHVSTLGSIGTTNFSGNIKFAYTLSYLTQVIIKRGAASATDLSQLVASPVTYTSPDPVVANGDQVVSTTLDNAVLGGNFLASPLVFAGASHHRFAAKTWSPVWANYTAQKGYLVLPKQLNTKYLKLEFTNLTPQPYPIVNPDIEVYYREFPITFSQDQIFTTNSYTATSLDSRTGVETQIDPNAVADKYGLSYGPLDTTLTKDIQITVGDALLTNIPHTLDYPVTTVTNVEPASSAQLLNVTEPSSMVVALAQNVPVVKGDTLIGIAARYGIADWHTILDLNSDLLNANLDRAVKAGYPRHTAGWWIFPGQKLRISTAQTIEWTNTTTVTEHTRKSTVNNKFTITSVHKYDIKKVKRDAAIAYFAGLKEVIPYREDLTQASDSQVFEDTQFQINDVLTYSMNNVAITSSSAVTNLISNPNFAIGIHGYNDANSLNAGLYDALTSFVLSNDFAYSGTLSCKLTYGTSTGKNQGLFVRLNNLAANAYVGYTWRTYTVASGVWTPHTAVVQANGSGQVDLPMVTSSAPTGGTVAYIDCVGAYIVSSANATVPNFFDGDFTRANWNGFVGESTSTISLPTGASGYSTQAITTNVSQYTNLVSNPSFETNTTGYVSGGIGYDTVTSIATDATQHYIGAQSMKITWKTYTTKQGVTFALTGLTNGQNYVAMARVLNKTANTTECFLECGGATGYTSSNLLRGSWQRLAVRWTQSGTTATLALATTAATNNDVTWVDAVAIFAIPTLYSQAPNYFDGSYFGNSWTGTANGSTSTTPTKGIMQSPVFNTWSQFRKITATLNAKPLDTLISGISGATALGVGGASLATWEDPLAVWADTTATWGAAASLASVNFTSDYIYNGVHSIWVHRASGGIGGVYSAPITPINGAHVRAEITVFLPTNLNITNVVKIVDAATKNTIYLQETITSPRGGWQTYVTNFIVSDGTQICVDIESSGAVASDLFIADMSLKQTTITMYASNDGFTTKLDLDNLVWKTTNTNAVFPLQSNRVQVRFEMLRVGDWISGYTVTPYYLT